MFIEPYLEDTTLSQTKGAFTRSNIRDDFSVLSEMI